MEAGPGQGSRAAGQEEAGMRDRGQEAKRTCRGAPQRNYKVKKRTCFLFTEGNKFLVSGGANGGGLTAWKECHGDESLDDL